jgi:hypothetical protein
MAGQVSPGIVLRERDLTAQTIVATQTSAAAVVGSFEKGPVGTITTISSEKQLSEIFGFPNDSNYEDWFTAASFLGYGGEVQVNRIPSTVLKNAVSDTGTATVDETALYVADSSGFSGVSLIKVDNEYILIDGITSGGSDTLIVDNPATDRGYLGSSEASHASGATVAAWSFSDSATTTTITEAVDATETVFDLTDSTGFAANDYVRVVDTVDNEEEIVKIVSVEEGNQVVVLRAQLGSTALVGSPNYTFTKLDFAATGATTTLSQAYPVVSGAGASSVLISNAVEYDLNAGSYTSFKFAARTAGNWANGYTVAYIDGSVGSYATAIIGDTSSLWTSVIGFAPPTANDLHILILDAAGNIVESFPFLSKLESALDEQGASRYYATVLRRLSSTVFAGALALDTGNQYEELSGGVNDYAASVADVTAAFDIFESAEQVVVDFLLCGGSFQLESDQITKAQHVIGLANNRKDCIAFVSPHKAFAGLANPADQRDDILDFFGALPSSSYAIFDSGYKYVYDRYNDKYRYIPCCGDVAGLCVRTSDQLEDWYSPAGLQRGSLRNAIKLAYVPSKSDRDALYVNRINPIASFPGQGIVLFGDKTALAVPSAFDRINVRRLFLALEKRFTQLARSVLFELNSTSTRSSFAGAANSFMSEVKAKQGVTDFLVVCDESNNTPEVIDRNEFVAEIYVKPSRSVNFVTVTLVATRTGVTFEEVTGQV